jgi:hypothetical protein
MRVSPDFNRINANACVLALMNGNIQQGRLHIALFSGTPPTDDRLITMLGTTPYVPRGGNTISEWATMANFLADLNVQAVTSVVDVETMTWNVPLSVQAGQFVVAQAGTPTWFMARYTSSAQSNTAFTDFYSGGTAQVIITGTVGDENSNAELKIVGGTVALNAPVRAADLRIKF